MDKAPKPIPFQQIIKALLNDEKPFPTRYLYPLSDISPEDVATLKRTWPKISLQRRQAFMDDVQQFNEDDFLLNFIDIGLLAIHDPDPHVRLMAVLILAEYEGSDLVPLFLNAAENDSQVDVRAASAAALGKLVQQGELDGLPAATLKKVESCLLRILDGQDAKQVRLSALEALGYSSMDEANEYIKNAFLSGDDEWVSSALIAMGRSYNEKWNSNVISMLQDSRSSVRLEAVRAAGELEIPEAASILIDLLQDNEVSVHQAAIWSLSQIGGNNLRDLFDSMLEVSEDDEDVDLLEAALENLEFTEGFSDLSLFDLDEDIEED
ncbi:MAG: HEAT repeat domain-containing protein [Candidatus Thorarchaeota archaeon]